MHKVCGEMDLQIRPRSRQNRLRQSADFVSYLTCLTAWPHVLYDFLLTPTHVWPTDISSRIPQQFPINYIATQRLIYAAAQSRSLRGIQRRFDCIAACLGVAEQHASIWFCQLCQRCASPSEASEQLTIEHRVRDVRITTSHAPFHHDDLLALVGIDDGHTGDGTNLDRQQISSSGRRGLLQCRLTCPSPMQSDSQCRSPRSPTSDRHHRILPR